MIFLKETLVEARDRTVIHSLLVLIGVELRES